MNESSRMDVKQAVEQGKIDALLIKNLIVLEKQGHGIRIIKYFEKRNIALYSSLESHIALETYE